MVNENSFQIALDQTKNDMTWVEAVLENTSIDTILIIHESRIHLGPFVGRALYFPSDVDGEATAGYSIPNIVNLL